VIYELGVAEFFFGDKIICDWKYSANIVRKVTEHDFTRICGRHRLRVRLNIVVTSVITRKPVASRSENIVERYIHEEFSVLHYGSWIIKGSIGKLDLVEIWRGW